MQITNCGFEDKTEKLSVGKLSDKVIVLHNEILTKQYLVACHKPQHPNASIVSAEPSHRNIRKTANN